MTSKALPDGRRMDNKYAERTPHDLKEDVDYTSHSTGGHPHGSMSSTTSRGIFGALPSSHGYHFSPSFIHAFSGATAGFASGVITCPLDVIKTKLQAQGGFAVPRQPIGGRAAGAANYHHLKKGAYDGLVGTARTIWKEDGATGFYRGLGPIILGYLPTWAVYFTVYEKCKQVLKVEDPKKMWMTHIASAMVAGSCSTLCTNPIWVIKTRLMSQASSNSHSVQTPWNYTSTLDAARKMYRTEGVRAFYSGLSPALLGLTHVAVQFPLYEQFKTWFISDEGTTDAHHLTGVLAASILSKICASSATYPHEVIRTRMQTQQRSNGNGPVEMRYKGVIHACKTVYIEEGWRAFYAGMGTNMIRAVPASAMTLLTYEFMVREMAVLTEDGSA